MSSVPTLGYFKIRGLAQPIRLLLNYAGVEFNEKFYEFGPGESLADLESIRKFWLVDKFNLGLDFPNVPYYMDGDIKLSQSLAILRYVGRKHGLAATDDKAMARQDVVEQQIIDLRMAFIMQIIFNWTDDKEKQLKAINDIIVPQLEQLEKFLGPNEWLLVKISYVDFMAYETLDWIRKFNQQTVEQFPNLKQYLSRFESLEPIKKYMSSPEFISWPIFGPVAKWGSK